MIIIVNCICDRGLEDEPRRPTADRPAGRGAAVSTGYTAVFKRAGANRMTMLIGLLGGTFDPIHVGHLRAAIECREQLGLARLDLLPAADPPLKAAPQVTAEQRLAMVQLAVQPLAGIGVDRRELDRPGTSYTVDTLRQWRAEAGIDVSLVFIVGQDVLPQLPRWSRWQELLTHCHIAVLRRPGAHPPLTPPVIDWLARHEAPIQALAQAPAGSVVQLQQPALAVSSTGLRAALADGRSVQFLLPDAVIEYIARNNLYSQSGVPQSHA